MLSSFVICAGVNNFYKRSHNFPKSGELLETLVRFSLLETSATQGANVQHKTAYLFRGKLEKLARFLHFTTLL
jgi:hypothetical protein